MNLVEQQHGEILAELRGLRQQRRDAGELPEAMLRRLRLLRLVEPPAMPQPSRRRPLAG
jgi:hypothetical protein